MAPRAFINSAAVRGVQTALPIGCRLHAILAGNDPAYELSGMALHGGCAVASHWHEIRRHLPVRQEVVHAAPALEAPCREMWRTAKLNTEGGMMAALGNDW